MNAYTAACQPTRLAAIECIEHLDAQFVRLAAAGMTHRHEAARAAMRTADSLYEARELAPHHIVAAYQRVLDVFRA